MSRSPLRHLRRCRVLFALALCAWLSLAGAAWAHADCCAGMGGIAGTTTMTRHGATPAPLHADSMHADCACAHATATLPALAISAWQTRFAATTWQMWRAAARELSIAPPLRPPLA